MWYGATMATQAMSLDKLYVFLEIWQEGSRAQRWCRGRGKEVCTKKVAAAYWDSFFQYCIVDRSCIELARANAAHASQVAFSASGWLARILLGTEPYDGTHA